MFKVWSFQLALIVQLLSELEPDIYLVSVSILFSCFLAFHHCNKLYVHGVIGVI